MLGEAILRALPDGQSIMGKAIRLPLRLAPRGFGVPVLSGPLRGMRWVVGSGVHGCWVGTYEAANVQRLASLLRPGMVCFDVGANVGYYSLLFSRFVGTGGLVCSFEPLPQNHAYFNAHTKLNNSRNVTLFPMAISDRDGSLKFAVADSRSMGKLAPGGSLTVETRSIDSLIAEAAVPEPDVLKVDVEGAELEVLSGARSLLSRRQPVILLATHGPDLHKSCRSLLHSYGYELAPDEAGEDILAYPRSRPWSFGRNQ